MHANRAEDRLFFCSQFQFSGANIITLIPPDPMLIPNEVQMISKIYFLAQFYLLSKTEKSRRVPKSRPVCVGFFNAIKSDLYR